MAFLAALSSSIGKKLLISALRHVDIFDTDPAKFVSVAVGKRTTLEARDVGLHVKKLVALLHLKLPPEFQLCKARASLLRITFVLDFGVPQILIDIDGIQIHARLAEDVDATERKRKATEKSQSTLPPLHRPTNSPPPFDDGSNDSDSDAGNDYVPTVDELAKSILREEPAEEIRELEDALNTQTEHLAESVASSDDGEEGSIEGLGAPLGLPVMLRNVINTALDRLEVVANHVDIQVEDQLPVDPSHATSDTEDPFVSLNFHIVRIAIDSLTSQDPRIDVASPAISPANSRSGAGRRRMRVENICARLISDADNFTSMSRVSRASSPIDTRSEISSTQRSRREARASQSSSKSPSTIHDSIHSFEKPAAGMAESQSSLDDIALSSPPVGRQSSRKLASSVLTADEDRFADAEAASEDGLDRSIMYDSSVQSQHSLPPREMTASSMLYDDADAIQYALENSLLNSTMQQPPVAGSFTAYANRWGSEDAAMSRESGSASISSEAEPTMSELFSPSKAQQSSGHSDNVRLSARDAHFESIDSSEEPSDSTQPARPKDETADTPHQPQRSPSPEQDDLSESRIFTHDDAESMYMSALSRTGSASSHHHAIPGAWDSASSSSQDTASDNSAPVPASMVAGSILGPVAEADDGCETPRPGSRQSVLGSSHEPRVPSGGTTSRPVDSVSDNKLSKLFLSIDNVTCWFPLSLGEATKAELDASPYQDSHLSFAPPNIAQDSIFQEMPGSFSNYASSASSKRRASTNVPESGRPSNIKTSTPNEAAKPQTKDSAATISMEIGTVVGHIDFSTGRIMFQLVDRLMKSLAGTRAPDQKLPRQDESTHGSRMSVELAVKYIGISWLERLMTESVTDITGNLPSLELSPLDAILRITLSAIHVASQNDAERARAKFSIGKFVLSSLNDDVLSFHTPKGKSRRSINNLPEQLKSDIEVDYEQGKDRRLSIVTRPVKVNFDMQKLDEALSSFGGFSGVLELGSSINSNLTNSPIMSTTRPKPRGVHFPDAPPLNPNTSSGMPKIDVQFGEVSFALKGKACALQLQTTSVRIAVRANNLRMKVSEVNLSGPYLDAAQKGAPLMVEVKGTTVNFLFAPEEVDLARLISMITPSKNPYENDEDILIDTLLRQRRKGSVLRVDVTSAGVRLSDLGHLQALEALGKEVAKLSKVTKYLPDDDRPGILTLAKVQQLDASVMVSERLGDISMACKDASVAHVGVPALFALEVGNLAVRREDEVLVSEVVHLRPLDQLPMIMARVIGDEMEPVVKAKLYNVCMEYHVTTIMAALGISDEGTVDDIALGLASSVATITGTAPKSLSRQTSESSSPSPTESKPLQIDILLRGCAIGLNPRKIPSKGLLVFTDARISGHQSKKDDYSISVELRSASVLAIDDIARIGDDEIVPSRTSAGPTFGERQLKELQEDGFVSLGSISGARVVVEILGEGKDKPQIIDVEFQTKLFLLESCADSTQTLIAILNGLQPPMPQSTAVKYRTVVPLTQMMESFTGDAVFAPEETDDENFMENADLVVDEVPTNLEFVGSFYNPESLPTEEDLGDSMLGEEDLGALAPAPTVRQRGERGLLESFQEQYEVTEGEQDFDFDDNYFKDSDSDPEHKGTARKWDSKKNKYQLTNEFKIPDAPLKLRVRELNIIWNLFDGYDWPKTRGVIAQAVEDVETRAEERRRRPREDDFDEDFVEADYLFNSVWIGVPIKDEKGALARAINHDIDDLASETGSYATSTATRSTGATARPRSATKSHRRKLKLERSKHKKISFDLRGVSVDFVVFPSNTGETQNSVNVRTQNFEIYDHVPSSTWRKFATSLIDPNEREMNRPMINLELLTVRPVTDLAASELVIKVTVQPLRLHVDQDALDFITRFFEFKDDTVAEPSGPSDQPFIQRLEVMSVTLKLDYKPKRIDYRGLRSGHTTEFMNFLILDGSDMVLRHAIVYGITSFDKLHKTLNDVWMPDIKRNQLPGVLAGLAAVRPLVNVGSGVRDLVVVPMREYKKDGRIVRSLQKGVYAFSKNTTSEIARLGAKVAIGAQTALEGAEKFLNPQSASPRSPSTLHDWDDFDAEASGDEEPRAHSNYANQPIGVKAGLLTAAKHLERDMLTAKDAIIAIPTEVWEEGTGIGMAKVVARRAPTVILRPALGATKAVSNALMGVGNALDKDSRRKIEDKYKSY